MRRHLHQQQQRVFVFDSLKFSRVCFALQHGDGLVAQPGDSLGGNKVSANTLISPDAETKKEENKGIGGGGQLTSSHRRFFLQFLSPSALTRHQIQPAGARGVKL